MLRSLADVECMGGKEVNMFVEIDPKVCGEKPVVRGTRMPLTVIVDQLAAAGSVKGILKKYPELSPEQIVGALRYCHSVIEHTELVQIE